MNRRLDRHEPRGAVEAVFLTTLNADGVEQSYDPTPHARELFTALLHAASPLFVCQLKRRFTKLRTALRAMEGSSCLHQASTFAPMCYQHDWQPQRREHQEANKEQQ